jgi:CRISPR-associated protein Cas2
MYVILVYDIKQERVGKMLKLCRRYLNWIQNSVFEGEITEVRLREMMVHARKFLREEEDSVLIFKSRDQKWLDKEVFGRERNPLDTFL